MAESIRATVGSVFAEIADALTSGRWGRRPRIGVTTAGSELGMAEIIRGAEQAQARCPDLEVVLIGPPCNSSLPRLECADGPNGVHARMEQALAAHEIDAAVTMHYNFPIGVATVGRVITPGRGREMFLATTTGTAATDRVSAMVLGAIAGVSAAKACGRAEPTVGILNIDGARQAERRLRELAAKGYPLRLAGSLRADGGAVLRGNDLLAGVPDVMVTDSLTGNVLMKVLSAYTTGGDYESIGYGYGPGIGEGYEPIILILSRASGSPVVAGAVRYAGDLVQGQLPRVQVEEYRSARAAGLAALLAAGGSVAGSAGGTSGGSAGASGSTGAAASGSQAEIKPPPAKVVTHEIPGVDILEIDAAIETLWRGGLFASPGMGCTGPVIMVAAEDAEKVKEALRAGGYLA